MMKFLVHPANESHELNGLKIGMTGTRVFADHTYNHFPKGNHVMCTLLLYHAFNLKDLVYRATRYIDENNILKAEPKSASQYQVLNIRVNRNCM